MTVYDGLPPAEEISSAALHGLRCVYCDQALTRYQDVGRVTDSRTYGRPWEFTVRACDECAGERALLAAVPRAVVMQPTTLCQLDCRYCYLPLRRTRHLMPVPVAEAVASSVNVWARTDKSFEVVWHGGEPLTAGRDRLRTLMDPFVGVKHSVQTNAALIDGAWCDFFADYDIAVGVSIDGPEAMDANRVTRAGRPAHREVLRGITRLRERDIPFSAIAVVSEPRPEQAGGLYTFFADLGCTALGINIEEQEGVNTRALGHDLSRATEFWAALADAWRSRPVIRVREIDRVNRFAARALADPAPRVRHPWDPLPTIAHDGDLVLLSPELAGFSDSRLSSLTTGNVLRTPLSTLLAEAQTRTPWLGEFQRGVAACRISCPYFVFCGGGHPANRYFEHGGRMDGTRTRYCTTSKIALLEGVTRHVRNHRD